MILTILIVGGIFLFKGNNKDTNVNKSETTSNYVAYIKINPSIKLEYKQVCNNNKCDEPIVLKYELVNDDAKNIFKDIDLLQNDNTLYKVIDLITETTKNNNIKFDKVEIYSNWNNAQAYMNENSKNKEIYKVSVNSNEELSKISNQLLKNEEVKIEKDNVNQETNSPNKDNVSNNKNPNNSQKPSQNEVPKKDPEPTTEKEITPGVYTNEAEGYGDYIVRTDVIIAGKKTTSMVNSKFGCKDAIDKKACKQFWINHWEPKVKQYENVTLPELRDWLQSYEEMAKRDLESLNRVKELEQNCKDPEYASLYELTCKDINVASVEKNYLGTLESIQMTKDNIEFETFRYNDHKRALDIYKNLPY